MKRTLLLISICFLTSTSRAQYHPLLEEVNVWSIVNNIALVAPQPLGVLCSYPFPMWNPVEQLATCGDTILNTMDYRILCLNGGCTFGYLREDTTARKVYFQDVVDSPEVVLYDFAMIIGDSIEINFPYSMGNYFPGGTYRLDSITTISIRAGNRNAFHLNCVTTSSPNTLTWVESVGNLGNVIYPYTVNDYGPNFFGCSPFPHEFSHFTSCFEHGEKVYFDSCAYTGAMNNICFAVQDSCNYFNTCGGVDELDQAHLLHLYPNPVTDKLKIQNEELRVETAAVKIFNIVGACVTYYPNTKLNLDVSMLSPGLYWIEIKETDKIFRGKFIRE